MTDGGLFEYIYSRKLGAKLRIPNWDGTELAIHVIPYKTPRGGGAGNVTKGAAHSFDVVYIFGGNSLMIYDAGPRTAHL
jgi:hypothetical protein